MEEWILKLIKSNDALKNYFSTYVAPRSSRDRRANIGICAIDDEPFLPQQNLRNYGYNIVPIGDIKTVSEVAPYDIVLCDIMGVGQYLDRRLQGASIISEIKKAFPEKYVIAYTGAAMNQAAAKQALELADETVRKDIDIDEWSRVLDAYADAVQNPHIVWLRIRASLIERGVDTRDVLLLENAYVRSVLNRDRSFSAMRVVAERMSIRDDIRAIINGIVSSIAFKFVFGG